VKALLKKADVSVLNYQDKSTAELLFNRRLWTKLPVPVGKLVLTFAEETCPQIIER